MLKLYWPAVVLTLAGFLLAYQFVDPAPPARLVMATGSEQGAYARVAEQYRRILADNGVQLEIRHTRGSLENLQLLSSGAADVAFVQGGTEKNAKETLYSLGSLYFEPVWLFYRAEEPLQRLIDLPGGRVAIGAAGSGTLALARELIEVNRLSTEAFELRELGGQAAVEQLLSGELDAVFLVVGVDSAMIQQLLRAPGVRLMSFRRAQAYTKHLDYLSDVVLSEGMIDMRENIPAHDVRMLAPAATLVSAENLHPALVDLLLQAAQQIHGDGGWFSDNGDFPSPRFSGFPLSPEASRFYKHGPPFLQRFLPFWAATLIDRLKVMLLPLVVIMLPLMKVMPPIYTWRMRARIYRWYDDLESLESRIRPDMSEAENRACEQELTQLLTEVRKVHVPLSFCAPAELQRAQVFLVLGRLRRERAAEQVL